MRQKSFIRPMFVLGLTLINLSLVGCGAILGSSSSNESASVVANRAIKNSQVRGFAPVSDFNRKKGIGHYPPLSSIPRVMTGDVRRELAHLRTKYGVRNVKTVMARAYPIIFKLNDVLKNYGVPSDVLVVPIVESGYNTKIVSPQGMSGLWQFASATGRSYGLRINMFNDDRKDPIKSTSAAARHFRDLYKDFRDWPLALAAYNAGAYRIKQACRGYSVCDFWTLSRDGKVPRITSRYVPKMIAHLIVLEELRLWPFSLQH